MAALPDADPATRTAFESWLEQFAGYVRDVDYASARPLWHPEVLIFGTHQDILQGVEIYRDTQWNNVWPRTENFHFDLARTRVLASDDLSMATVLAPWTSTGVDAAGRAFDRPGRATLVFHRRAGRDAERWLCVHSHMSLNRGVPQESFGDRPVKAW